RSPSCPGPCSRPSPAPPGRTRARRAPGARAARWGGRSRAALRCIPLVEQCPSNGKTSHCEGNRQQGADTFGGVLLVVASQEPMTSMNWAALLLTDVVDSTKLSETLGDADAAALWAAHDRLARDLLPAWR